MSHKPPSLADDGDVIATAPPQVSPPWRTFVLIGVVLGLTQLGYYLTAAALPLYLRDLGASQGRIGFEVGLGNLAGVAVTLFVGPAINRRGPEVFLRAGALLYAFTALGMLIFQQEIAVTAFRTLQGVGTALIGPSAMVLGARLLPGQQGAAIGILGMLNSAALASGPPIGLALYSQHGPSWLFVPAVAASGLGLLSTVLIRRGRAAPSPAVGFGFDRMWAPSLVSNCLSAMYFGGILAYLPLVLRQAHGPNAGIFFTADAIGVLLLRVPTGMLVDRAGSLIPKLIGLAITFPGIAALALPPSIGALVVSGACTGIGAGLFVTSVLVDLAALSDESNRGTALSLGNGSFSAAIFAGSAISGLLIGSGGFDAVLLFGGITCAAALPFIWMRPVPKTNVRPGA